jgi:intracellular sulfur oxidation DsrE/DsrF family protein
MNRRIVLQSAAASAAAAFLATAAAQSAGSNTSKRHKLVLQVSDADPAKWNLALNNAENVQEDVGAANVDVEIVAYGPGIGMLKADSVVASRVADATKAGVKVVACQNAMRSHKLTNKDMNPVVGYVPAGVTELMTRQAEGWSYVRP